MDVTESSPADTTEEVPKFYKDKTNEEQAGQKDKVQKKLGLPPEYDESDSRWTLKYREPAEGLVELIEDSRVYVNIEKLTECEELSSDSNRLAQLLLTKIFSISALSTCSWPGTNANATNKNIRDETPELDAHATNILLRFVKEYAQRHCWELTDCNCIVKNLRQIMLRMRQKKLVSPIKNHANDTRWTLKYLEPAPGLVELMEHSGVYVNAEELAKCKKLSNDCVTLARMLLSKMFSTSALTTCLVTAEYMKQSVTDVRPVLDEHAMLILLIFAVEYGQEKNWSMVIDEKRCIKNSIRQKIEVVRRVQRKTVEEEERDKVLQKYCSLGLTSLPPEYDANDSRWTLKYREPAPGLVELIEHSGVYVNADKLAECKEVSKDCVTLAQKLLTEVFIASALATCSLAIKNSECYEFYGMQRAFRPKPELDPYAEIILLNYVDEYGLEQGWRVLDFRYIKKGMTDIMRQMETQYALKQKELKHTQVKASTITEENSWI